MDTEHVKSWVNQPDVCRCCLSTSGSWDLCASYVNKSGNKVIFSDLIMNCFGINMSFLSEWGPSRLICALCMEHLEHAYKFKMQVLQAEEQFALYFNEIDNHVNTNDIKIEPEFGTYSPDYLTEYNEIKDLKRESHIKRKRSRKRKSKECKVDPDSDTPLNEISRAKEMTNSLNRLPRTMDKIEPLDGDDNVDIPSQGCENTKTKEVKLVSERKRIRITCEVILKHTTACPFRHHKSWFQCFYCTLEFMEINQLRIHIFDSHNDVEEELKKIKRYPRSLQIDITNFNCNICNFNLVNVETMLSHFLEKHDRVVYKECIADYKVNSSPYTCHLCDKQFHVFRTLTTHLNEHYANCICDVCGKSYLNSKRLKVHKRTHESGNFPCSECGKILKTKISKANHMESAHSKRVIKCQICFKPMKHYNDRIKHMSLEHNITHKFKCVICAKEYNIKHYLATHMRQTHGHKNKKCKECGMAFITNHGLKKHMQKHSGVKSFSCEVCSKTYARSYTLREHMRLHENERQFITVELIN